jgi:MFS family permease
VTQVAEAAPVPHGRLGGLPRAFWALWAGSLINRMGTMVVPFMTLYLVSARGLSVRAAGEVMAAFGVGSMVSQVIGGVLADRVGRRITLLGGTLATAVLMVTLAYLRPVPAIAAVVALLGVTVESYRPAAQSLVADLVPAADHVRAYGLLFWAGNLGFAVAMSAAGLLARVGFAWLFWVDALTGALFGLLVWRAVAPGPSGTDRAVGTGGGGGGGRREGFADVLRDRTMVAFTACVLVYYFVYFQSDATLSLAMRAHGVGSAGYGLCMALNGVLVCLAQPWIGARLGRRDPARVWAGGVLVVGVGFALTGLAHSVPAYLGTVAVWTVGETLPAAVSGAIVARLAPARLRGRYAGLYGLAWSSGWLTSSLGGTRLFAHSPAVLWISCGLLAGLAATGARALAPRMRHPR